MTDAAVLDHPAALHELAPEWQSLWARAGAPPFQSPAWLLSWWEVFGTAHPRVATLRRDGALVGLLPLYLLEEGPQRKLLPVGIGITDHLDALLDPELPEADIDLLLHAALARAALDRATSCALPDLPPGAGLRRASLPIGWTETLRSTPCPVLTLRGDGPGIPAGTLRNLRQSRHRADRDGGWATEVAPAGEALALWQELVRMHQARWDRLGQPGGVLADPCVAAFHRLAVPRLAAAGILRMQVLRRRGRVAAVYHTMIAPGRLLFYLSGFDEADAAVSPGTLLLGRIVEQARDEGLRELDFLRGVEPYKLAWGAVDRPNLSRFLTPAR